MYNFNNKLHLPKNHQKAQSKMSINYQELPINRD
jgi:hypothetical protein